MTHFSCRWTDVAGDLYPVETFESRPRADDEIWANATAELIVSLVDPGITKAST
jgi:hypothetical protein